VLGAAKLLRRDLARSRSIVEQAHESEDWWPRDRRVSPDLPLDDARLLASWLTDEAWTAVSQSLSDLATADELRAESDSSPRYDDYVQQVLSDLVEDTGMTMGMLDEGEIPSLSGDEDDLPEFWQRIPPPPAAEGGHPKSS
jgi:hypothetical protein